MNEQTKQELAMKAAAKVHAAWCEGELKAFHKRLVAALEEGKTVAEAMEQACFKGDKRRNGFELHGEIDASKLTTFEGFMEQIKSGEIEVMRFTGRTLTEAEQAKAGKHYVNGQENILRPFEELSAASQAENLSAAVGAVAVYEEYAKRGATLEMLLSKEAQRPIGMLIHADWMERNPVTENNSYLFVKFDSLDDWTKGQDLDVFYAALGVIMEDPAKYAVAKEDNLPDLNPTARENAVIEAKVKTIK